MQEEIATPLAKLTPAIGYVSITVMGIPLSDWVTILTAIYIVIQLVLLIPKVVEQFRVWRLKWRSKRDSSRRD